ncbi:hypothetical protein ACFQ9X_23850 [Catenulispora yoronensis]
MERIERMARRSRYSADRLLTALLAVALLLAGCSSSGSHPKDSAGVPAPTPSP